MSKPMIYAALMGAMILASASQVLGQTRGVWFDYAGIDRKNAAGEVANLKRYGIGRVHIQISAPVLEMELYETCKKTQAITPIGKCLQDKYIFGFDKWASKRADREQLGDFVDQLDAAGMTVVLMIWPSPTRHYLASLSNLADFTTRHSVYGVELEDEENWNPKYLDPDFGTIDKAADAVFSTLRAELPKSVKVGVTVAPRDFSVQAAANDHLLGQADFISFQTYQGVCDKTGEHCPTRKLGKEYAAGRMQERAFQTLSASRLNTKPLILGVPAYDQDIWPSSGENNMYLAMRASVCGELQNKSGTWLGNSYWSMKNIDLYNGDKAYAKRFLLYCTSRAVAPMCKRPAPTSSDAIVSEIRRVCPSMGE